VDYPNLTEAQCYIGTAQSTTDYSQVMTGVTAQRVDYGYTDKRSRHTIVDDTTAYDSNTNNQLRCVPVGAQYSVRLGSRYNAAGTDYTSPGKKAQRIEYPYTVSSKGTEQLVVHYAVVCNATMKSSSGSWVEDEDEQPKFFIRVLDGSNVVAQRNLSPSQANAGNANVITDPLYGSGSDYRVIWYQWDSINIDMASYAGRSLTFEITTSDCSSSKNASHFCYAYFTINCRLNAIYETEQDTTCEESYTWRGRELTQSGVYADTVVNGGNVNDTVYTLMLEMHGDTTTYISDMICEGQEYEWNGQHLTIAGTYEDSLISVWGCDSIVRLSLMVDSNLIYSKWKDLIFCDNGQDRWASYQWYRDGAAITGETKQYLYLPNGMGNSEYYVVLTDTTGMQYTTCKRTFDDTPRSADQYGEVVQMPGKIHIRIPDAHAQMRLFSACGRMIMQRVIETDTTITTSLPTGIYMVYLQGETGRQTHTILMP